MKELYVLSENFSLRNSLRLQLENKNLSKKNLFEGAIQNVSYVKLQGKKVNDLIATGASSIYLISPKVIKIFRDHDVSGWGTYEVQTYMSILEDYKGLAICGKSGPIRNEMSKKTKMKPMIPGGPEYFAWLGLHVDNDSWDGSDIFSPSGSFNIFVTPKVKQLIERHKLTNFELRKNSEVENMNLLS